MGRGIEYVGGDMWAGGDGRCVLRRSRLRERVRGYVEQVPALSAPWWGRRARIFRSNIRKGPTTPCVLDSLNKGKCVGSSTEVIVLRESVFSPRLSQIS